MKKIFLSAAAIIVAATATAQSAYDVFQYSQKSSIYGTARVSAMGGAFTSLGADASAMSINPAGLGLYRSSEISISPSIKMSSTTTETDAATSKYRSNQFNLNNVNAIFTLVKNDQKLFRGLTIGFGYNVDASLSSKSLAKYGTDGYSIVDSYADMLTNSGLSPKDITVSTTNPFDAFHQDPSGNLWGAIDAFNNGLIASTKNAPWGYVPDERSFVAGDKYDHEKLYSVKGRNETYNVSLGFKLGNFFNFGMSLGVGNYYATYSDTYTETAIKGNRGDYDGLKQWDGRRVNGTSFDFKVGTILEPAKGLRLGVAYHAPRTTLVTDTYYVDQEAFYSSSNSYYTESATRNSLYEMKSPSRLLTGASYVVKNIGIISFDWERTWYSSMELNGLRSAPGETTVNDDIRGIFKPSDTYRVGAEVGVGAGFFVRGGYSYSSSPIAMELENPEFDESVRNISGGIGYRKKAFFFDLAYINSVSKHLAFSDAITQYKSITKESNNILTFTLGFKF